MASFSITDAATAGFASVRRHPKALVAWAGVGLVAVMVSAAVFYFMVGDKLQAVAAVVGSGQQLSPEQAYELYKPLFPAYGAALVVAMIAYSFLMPAVYRSVLKPEVRSPGYLKLGGDEVRQLVVNLVVFGLAFGVDAGLGYAVQSLAAATGAPAVAVIGSFVSLALVIFLLVRLSLVGPETLMKARLSFAGAWKLSKGAFWPMLGAYALAVLFQIMLAVGSLILMGVVVGVTAVIARLGAVGQGISLVLMVLYLVATCLIYALGIAVMAAPAAKIYRDLTGGETAS
jgi:hypothetical protein